MMIRRIGVPQKGDNMKKKLTRILTFILAMLCVCSSGAGVYADDVLEPNYNVAVETSFGLEVGSGYAKFFISYLADPDLFDHAEWEMQLQKKGLIFWGDVDIQISQMWFYDYVKDIFLRQEIPVATGKYRAIYTLRVVGTDGSVDTITGVSEYTYG